MTDSAVFHDSVTDDFRDAVAAVEIVKTVEADGGGQLSGDVTLSEGANITLTTVGNDIEIASTGSGGAPDTADYLVGTAQAGLSAEIVVGTAPGGELGGTWASPTVDAVHSGSSHAATQAAAEATAAAALSAHVTDPTDAHDATAISFSPAGTISATDVQAAIEEVAAEAGSSSFGVEVPSGTVNGVNVTFTLSEAPDPSADLLLWKNGLLMKQGLDYTLSSATITFDAGNVPQTGDILLAAIPTSGGGGGGSVLVSHTEFTSDVSITATTEGSANTVVTAPAFTADGSTLYLIEFFSPAVIPSNAAAGRNVTIILYLDGSSIGRWGTMQTSAAGFMLTPFMLGVRLTPASGSRTYSVRAIVNAGTGIVSGGAGGSGNFLPGYIRISEDS